MTDVLNNSKYQVSALLKQGLIEHKNGDFFHAINTYEKVLKLDPKNYEAIYLLAIVYSQAEVWDKATFFYDEAMAIDSKDAFIFYNKGIALQKLQKLEEALLSYRKAIEIKSDLAEAYFNCGVALNELNKYNESLINYEKAIEINPDYADAYANRGDLLRNLGKLEEALKNYDIAISIKKNNSKFYTNRGIILNELNNLKSALLSFNEAIQYDAKNAEAYANRGNVLKDLGLVEDSLKSFSIAIALKPELTEAYINQAIVFSDLKRYEESLQRIGEAYKINPEIEFLLGLLIYSKILVCDWTDYNFYINKLYKEIEQGKRSSQSFPLLLLTDSLKIQSKVAHLWVKNKAPLNQCLGPIVKNTRKDKIRLAYYSADFHNHATSHLMAELFEIHDKQIFELIAISFGPEKKDEMRKRLVKSFDKFIDVRLKTNKQVASLSRDLGIDIAVDLKGLTKDSRIGIFSYRAAPIQVNFMGYPGTLSAEYIDYIIADQTLIPLEDQLHYTEKIAYLPHSYQVNDRKRKIADKIFTKKELGLPVEKFIFCCFNNNFKITPSMLDSWVKILKGVKDSVIWLLEDTETSLVNLRKEAQKRGVDPNRLIFAKRIDLPEHLARHKCADLFLDTLPCNAHTTASDALWAGLPILTCVGKSFASRVTASLLKAIEVPELITYDLKQYEKTAIELALNPEKLQNIKNKLRENKLKTPLFDTKRYTENLENLYKKMYKNYINGEMLVNIYLEE